MAKSLYQRALGYSHKAVKIFMPAGAEEPVYAEYIEHYPPDVQAASLWLRNRHPNRWRDKQEHAVSQTHTLKGELSISPEGLAQIEEVVRGMRVPLPDPVRPQPPLLEARVSTVGRMWD